ncbi:BAL_1a_G0002550.mRNA.1.CDS.1 [Saccharomyces cerevisiae]|nr:BAL_1a_G0002550.mRNA.1.CDS.1 [Saccharomyces cerevisiae]CAI7043082.1 BAL_1a_G0002550.mRNA.1.CDS.1 [Saccharomyces cerevisiae]
MEELGLKSTFPYEYGSDFTMIRTEMLNTTKNETTILFSNIKSILAIIWKYSFTFLRSFSDSIKLIIDDVVTIGSRNFAERLQIEAKKNNDQEDIWASTIILGVIIGYLISSIKRKNTFPKIPTSSPKIDDCSFKTGETISIVINFNEDCLNNRSDVTEERNYEESTVSHSKESVLSIGRQNMVTLNQSDENFTYGNFNEYDLLSKEDTTEVLTRSPGSNPEFKAVANGTLLDSANEMRFKSIEKSMNETMVKVPMGCNVSLSHYGRQYAPGNISIMRSFSARDTKSVSREVRDICKSFLIIKSQFGDELFLTMFMEEPVFFDNNIPIEITEAYREKRERLDEVIHKDLIRYDEVQNLTRIRNLLRVKSQKICSRRHNSSVPTKKLLVNDKGATSILLWYSNYS